MSDYSEDLLIFPMNDWNDYEFAPECNDDIQPAKKIQLSLRERRRSKAGISNYASLNLSTVPINPIIEFPMALSPLTSSSPAKLKWIKALKMLKTVKDPWTKFKIDLLPTAVCKRHRYKPLQKKWVVDEIKVKMEQVPFGNGALRECFRMKKLSNWSKNGDWKHAHNYVAKRYMIDVEKDVYFDDVRLQLDAKLWGEEYDRHNPPKKVDIMQMCIIEFIELPGSPIYHLEHFIEGNYIKYNSNSGFVDEHLRSTPQAFSHFTFERSGHQLIVVDIQGVGDLWTDPQVHTAKGTEYGDGNLGTKGMALFFHSHVCNSICHNLGLSEFDLSSSEIVAHQRFMNLHKNTATQLRGNLELCVSPSPSDCLDLSSFLEKSKYGRAMSCGSDGMCETSSPSSDLIDDSEKSEDLSLSPSTLWNEAYQNMQFRSRRRDFSESSDSNTNSVTEEEERIKFHAAASKLRKPSCFSQEISSRLNIDKKSVLEDSILGQVHHELAKYHDIGRLIVMESEEPDMEAALFHEQYAATLGNLEAILTLAHLYLDIQRDILVNFCMKPIDENLTKGLDYMLEAAEAGDRSAMIYLAKAYETGNNLGSEHERNHKIALDWYEMAIESTMEDDGIFDSSMNDPLYTLKSKIAELYFGGEYGLHKSYQLAGDYFTEAAELATSALKGRLANEFYAKAEDAYSYIPD